MFYSRQPLENFRSTCSRGGSIEHPENNFWRLSIPPGGSNQYRLAQLDDYRDLPRKEFVWKPGCGFRLNARASAQEIPGTWGFGFWNDPFSMGLLGGKGRLRLPILPQSAWYFFASQHNYLSFRDDIPGAGNLAMSYAPKGFWNKIIYLGLPAGPLLFFSPVARVARKLLSRIVRHDSVSLDVDVTVWHVYQLRWEGTRVVFEVDHQVVFKTEISPTDPLGFVLWIDNQYAAFSPTGQVGYGFLPASQQAWIEIKDLVFEGWK